MPIYEYRCENEHRFEVLQKFSDEALTSCEICDAPAVRVLYPAAIHFKGSGFYSTDYGRRGKKSEAKGDGGGDSSKSGDSGGASEKKSSDSSKAKTEA
jgi:putative FmdB family regulatory protein